jgi:hypothetical protein
MPSLKPSPAPPTTLSTLPAEIILLTLSHLPIASVLSFGLTSHQNHTYTLSAITSLCLAIFPTRVHALIAFLETFGSETGAHANAQTFPHNHVPVILPSPPTAIPSSRIWRCPRKKSSAQSRPITLTTSTANYPLSTPQITAAQNNLLSNVLSQYGPALTDLEFLAFDLTSVGALALSTHLPSLRRLALRFDHPHIRHRDIDRLFWDSPHPGATLWNYLGGVEKDARGTRNETKLSKLECLIMERAGITEWQLQQVVERNPRLKELRLKKCNAVGTEFLTWLGCKWAGRANLEVLWLEKCEGVNEMDGIAWVDGLTGLKVCFLLYFPPFKLRLGC